MRLYHGSNQSFSVPELAKCRPFKDFGLGFYLTEEEAQAAKMAHFNQSTITFHALTI